jgi:hypothetical protein
MGIEVAIGAFGRAKRPMDVKRKRFHAGLLRYSSFTPEASNNGWHSIDCEDRVNLDRCIQRQLRYAD